MDTDAAEAMDKSLKAEIETLVNSVQVLSSSLNDRMDSLEKLVTQSLLAKESKTAQCLPSNGTNLIQTIHAANIVKAEPSNATQWFPTFPPSSIVKTEPSAQSSSVSSAPTQFLLKPAAIIQNANEPTKKAFDFEDSSGRYTLINPFLSTRTASTVQSRSPRRYTQNPSVPQLKRPVPAFNVIPSTALQGNASKFNAEKFTWNNLKK